MNSSNRNSGGFSEADNEMLGRLLLLGVAGIAALAIVAISPIIIGGLLIGLTWSGAYMEDGEPDVKRIMWPVVITLATFVFAFGMIPPFDGYYPGVVFRDFHQWTSTQISYLLVGANEWLPKGYKIKSVTIQQVRIYAWLAIPTAIATVIWLQVKAGGRGVLLYRGVAGLFAPARALASRWSWLAAVAAIFIILVYMVSLPLWARQGVGTALLLMIAYRLIEFGIAATTDGQQVEHSRLKPIALGNEKGKPHRKINLSNEQVNHHVHIVGASGFGKSVLLSHILKNRIETGGGVLFLDLKADFETIRQVVSTAHTAGRSDELYIFSCGNPEISSPYNVVANGTANQLKDRIMSALNWSEEYYKNEASSFLLKLLRGLTAVRDLTGKRFDLGTILDCADDHTRISQVIATLPESELEAKQQLSGLISYLSKADNQRALRGLRSQLEALLLSDFGHLLRTQEDGIDLFEAIRSKKIVYVLLDSRTYGESSKALGKLILQDLKAASAKVDNDIPRDQRTPFSVIVDEFADMATEDFVSFLDRARSSKIGVVVAHQEIADLSRINPEFSRRLMNSTSTLFAFLQKLPESSELISGIAGTRKAKEVTEQAKTDWLFGEQKTGMKSVKEVDEYIIHPNVIRSLGVGECVLIQKYPRSKAMIVKVSREAKDYLSDNEIRSLLSSRAVAQQSRLAPDDKRSIPTPPVVDQDDSYWRDDEPRSF